MPPSISVHEGDSYDPNGPLAEMDRKVTVTTDQETEDMNDDERAKTRRGVDPETLQKAQEDFEDGEGAQHLDLRSKEQQEASEGDDEANDDKSADDDDKKSDDAGVKKGDESSPGTSSSTSSTPGAQSTKPTSFDNASTVPSAVGPSKEDNAAGGTARQVTGKKEVPKRNH